MNDVEVSNFYFENCKTLSSSSGGGSLGLNGGSKINVKNSIFSNSRSDGKGGSVYITSSGEGIITLNNCTFFSSFSKDSFANDIYDERSVSSVDWENNFIDICTNCESSCFESFFYQEETNLDELYSESCLDICNIYEDSTICNSEELEECYFDGENSKCISVLIRESCFNSKTTKECKLVSSEACICNETANSGPFCRPVGSGFSDTSLSTGQAWDSDVCDNLSGCYWDSTDSGSSENGCVDNLSKYDNGNNKSRSVFFFFSFFKYFFFFFFFGY
jgi:hypothetical protein